MKTAREISLCLAGLAVALLCALPFFLVLFWCCAADFLRRAFRWSSVTHHASLLFL